MKSKKQLNENIKEILQDQKDNWKHLIYAGGKFYQSYEPLMIIGSRSTKQRFETYDIKKYLTKSKSVLDIGGNTGFFSLYISPYVKDVDVVEINPYLCKVGQVVRDFQKIKNVNFVPYGFEKYKTLKKYDIVMSYASDEVADGLSELKFKEYIDKIIGMMNDNALIFFESQAEDIMFNKFDAKLKLLEKYFYIIYKIKIGSTYPVNVKERVFLVGMKKDGTQHT